MDGHLPFEGLRLLCSQETWKRAAGERTGQAGLGAWRRHPAGSLTICKYETPFTKVSLIYIKVNNNNVNVCCFNAVISASVLRLLDIEVSS